MCLAYIAYRTHPDWPLFIAANRDEFHARPTQAAAPWESNSDIIAGIDLQAKGTWLGVSTQGRFALLTNYRDLSEPETGSRSRGFLVSDFLRGEQTPAAYMQEVAEQADTYSGFNLLAGDATGFCYFGNRGEPQPQELEPGRYVLSNHLLNSPWPKAERLRRRLGTYPNADLEVSLTPIFEILKDNGQAPDPELPKTGLSLERERLLSSPFIISPDYGTRSSSVIAIHRSGWGQFDEITYNPEGIATEWHSWPFQLKQALKA